MNINHLTIILIFAWMISIRWVYHKEIKETWKKMYPDGFGKNYPEVVEKIKKKSV